MAVSELSLEAIHEYILEKGGKVANRELVHNFKKYLINADKNEARIRFKEYVNKIACSKTENGEKFIILRSKYASVLSSASTPVNSPQNTVGIPSNFKDVSPVPSPSKARHPPPYRPPPPVSSPSPSIDNISLCSSSMSMKDMEEPPQAPPRRKSQSSRTPSVEVEEPPQQQQQQQEQQSEQQQQQSEPIAIPQQPVENSEQSISVKERTQKFNRLASVENDLSPQPPQTQKDRRRQPEMGADEDDGASVTSLDNKRTEWVVAAARGDYQALAKLAAANPRLVKTKEPFSTALHWAAKHGNSDIVKLIAGTYSADVNARTNGGYTALHIAMQFGRKEISELLIDVYHAQRDIRDWSGHTAEYYSTQRRNTSKSDNYHKMKIMKKSSEKDLGFLRIGSLNVRVKKTTEAFSNFLGVGGSSGSITPIDHVLEKVHKSWGSADNVSKDNEMAAPKLMPHNKRKLKYTQEQTTSYSTPGTPNQKRALPTHQHNPDSDSDTACGFDSNWKQ